MTYIRLILLSVCLFATSYSYSQSYSRVKVMLDEEHSISQLARLGIAIDHGAYAPFRFYINDLSGREIAKIKSEGFVVETLIEDAVAYYQNPNRAVEARDGNCFEGSFDYEVPENFELGSMGGFYTWEELQSILDDMQAKYPNLITVKAPIEGHSSHEGYPIYQVKISDNPAEDEDEPEVLYTALHHAREPNSLTQLIFYMWYILEHYETDANIQYLIDNTALYFIPCVNPDGYIHNQTTNPNGGGLWRKNRKVIDGDTLGVDLNRNYGYRWGYNDNGSSPSPESEVYRGHLPFSEPETQAVRDFCNMHHFIGTLNYHTFGNLLIYPWGYSDMPTADSSSFNAIAKAMTLENNFLSGTGVETVGYTVNGDSDDWMYGEDESKPSILSMTPEVGVEGGFWPAPTQIIPNCKSTILMNLTLAELPHSFAIIKDQSDQTYSEKTGFIRYEVQRIGMADGDFNVKLIPVSDNIASPVSEREYSLEQNETTLDSMPFILDETIENGSSFSFILELSNDAQTWTDTLYKQYLNLTPVFINTDFVTADWGSDLPAQWVATTATYHSPENALKESPQPDSYPNNYQSDIISPPIIIPNNTLKAFIQFYAKWDIEKSYDYAQVLLSVNGNEYVPLCGKYSSKGSGYQDEDNPVYDGKQADWILESIEISEEVNPGDEIRVKFLFEADNYVSGEGIFIDDFKIAILPDSSIPTENPIEKDFTLGQNIPNPAQNGTQITISSRPGTFSNRALFVYNVFGEVVYSKNLDANPVQMVSVNTTNWSSGVYFYRLQTDRLFSSWKKIIISK